VLELSGIPRECWDDEAPVYSAAWEVVLLAHLWKYYRWNDERGDQALERFFDLTGRPDLLREPAGNVAPEVLGIARDAEVLLPWLDQGHCCCPYCHAGGPDGHWHGLYLATAGLADEWLWQFDYWDPDENDILRDIFGNPIVASDDGIPSREELLAGDTVRLFAEYQQRQMQAEVLRDIFGNPFRPMVLDPDWRNDRNVLHLARGIYEEGAFERMPILGDALEDAGCTDGNILQHCRESRLHVRGCHVLDALLGKT
jgi:hypothetical protein